MMKSPSSSSSAFNMAWLSFRQFLLVFSCTWFCLLTLTHGLLRGPDDSDKYTLGGGGGGKNPGKIVCNDTKALDVCFNKLPLIKDHGIPSNPQAVEKSCKVFNSGMDCVDNWSAACLNKQEQEKVKNSVIGALETYRLLCKDPGFQRDFLRHADCYKRISHNWDECARKFIESLKRVDHAKDLLSLCCIRYRYLHCVTEVASRFCTPDATKFLQRLAESLVRSTMLSYNASKCGSVAEKNCSGASGAAVQSSAKAIIQSSFLFRLMSAFSSLVQAELINSLNVLHHSKNAFTADISALFAELTSFFNFNHLDPPPEKVEDNFLQEEPTTTANARLIGPFCNHNNYNNPV